MTALEWPDPPTPAPPLQPDGTPLLADGRVFVQIARPNAPYKWGGDPSTWDTARWGYVSPSTILDATCDVLGCSIRRGREDPLEHYAPAQFSATLEDPLRRWSPAAVTPDGVRVMRVGTPLRVVALDVDNTAVTLFAGTVLKAQHVDDGSDPPIVGIEATGSLAALEADSVTPPAGGNGELAGARMARVIALSHYRVDWWGTAFATGSEPLRPFDVPDPGAADDGVSALELLQKVADSDGGTFLEAADGTVTYLAPGDLEGRFPRFRFTDDPANTGDLEGVCPAAITFRAASDSIVNAVAVANSVDPPSWLRAEDPVSISWVGRRPVEVELLFTYAAHGQGLADGLLERACRDEFQIGPLQGEALTLPGWFAAALHLELGDPIEVRRNDHAGTFARATAAVQSVRHDITRRAWAVEVGCTKAKLQVHHARWNRARWDKDLWP